MRDGYGSAEYAALYGGKEMSLAQLHGSYLWHEVGLVGVPQGWAGPKEAEALHARLNDVPEMQHWPGGKDMARSSAASRYATHTGCVRSVSPLHWGHCFIVGRFGRRLDSETANTPAPSSSVVR